MKNLIALIILMAVPAFARDIHVAPAGDDAADATPGHPIATLARAQTLARQSLATHEPATVILHAGTYYLPETLTFTPEDSGTADHPALWQAAENETPILSGGQPLQLTWRPYKDAILQAQLPAEASADQLFINDQPQILARYPNFDPAAQYFHGTAPDALTKERAANWATPAGGFVHGLHRSLWGSMHYRITGKDSAGNVTLDGGWQMNRPAPLHPTFRFVENIFEELDAPGEFFLNPQSHILFFYPPPKLNLGAAKIETVRLKQLIAFRGAADRPVQFITLRGLTFTHTARTFMETREPILRSDWCLYRGAALTLEGTQDCIIESAIFDRLGGNALFVSNFNRRFTIRDSLLTRSGASGILFVGDSKAVRSPSFDYAKPNPSIDPTPGPLTENYPADCLVENCLIHDNGQIEKQSAGVNIDIARRITVRHCSIYDVPRAGINIGDGCWGGHTIEFCDVFDTVKETGDHGSFNSWGRDRFWQRDSAAINAAVAANPTLPKLDALETITLHDNRFRCDHGWDIDLDDGSSNYHIFNNLCLAGGIKNREGYARLVENNITAHNGFHPHVWLAAGGDIVRRNIFFQPYKPARMPAPPWGEQMNDNFLHAPGAPGPAQTLQKQSGRDEHSLAGDALFVDPSKGDFIVAKKSPAITLGFTNFPMNAFGVTTPRLKALAHTPSFAPPNESIAQRPQNRKQWLTLTVRNVSGMGDVSSLGLPGETGIIVVAIPASHPFAAAGLKKNDVIIQLGNQKIDAVGDLPEKMTLPATAKLYRDQSIMEIKLPPAD